jgi:2-polyprenyl-3-methyl-5-hydroxy-6-metoxy-1,4-benzoquinol methylase
MAAGRKLTLPRAASAADMKAEMLESIKRPLQPFRLYRALRFVWHCTADRTFRYDQLMRLRRPRNMFQYRSLTSMNRYPGIFAFLQKHLATVERPRLLSFGCATGEEVFTLRRYFPRAELKGIDINAQNILACRAYLARNPDAGITFAQQDSAAGEEPESYDAILCLAVFQHQSLQDPAILSCERYIRFEAFEATLVGLARCLKTGGFLALRHMDFQFLDTACSAGFRAVHRIMPGGASHPRFDRHNRRLSDAPDSDVVFQKMDTR